MTIQPVPPRHFEPAVARELLRLVPGVVLCLAVGLFALASRWPWGWIAIIGALAALLAKAFLVWGCALDIEREGLYVTSYFRRSVLPWGEIARFELDDPRSPQRVYAVFRPDVSNRPGQHLLPPVWPGRERELAAQLDEFRMTYTP